MKCACYVSDPFSLMNQRKVKINHADTACMVSDISVAMALIKPIH